ncbi:ATPase, T2SS/T4P/T4SS family [Clostridium intestinale]|uniref:CpaF family protein n=1 Tax=Clostridium intestinale TaxID=36845 RepID=A0A7D6VT63_9CLOT|nr:ATPase, T2SS/T4P/T4SS family [Clostridium intestinale]QLY81489.1 CpaF family protein [Clostridium intestinale]
MGFWWSKKSKDIVEEIYEERLSKEKNNIENIEEIDEKPIEERPTIDFDKIIDEVLVEFIVNRPTIINAVERGLKSRDEFKEEILIFLKNQEIDLNDDESKELIKRFETYIWGYGILQELIDNPDVSDIKTIDYDNIRIKVKGKREQSNIKFSSRESFKKYINYIAIKNNALLSEINAIQKFTDKTSSKDFILRINISSEFINSSEMPYLIIRKIPKNKYDLNQLERLDMLNGEVKEYLKEAMLGGLTIFTTGKGASGKTTLMNALLDEIPYNNSCLVIQEAEELFTYKHPDMMFQKVKYAKGDSKIEYTLRDLSINGLLADLDYFVIGEIKGGEAYDMANAIYTGHVGMASVHGNSAEEALNKMVHYMKYVSDMNKGELTEMLTNIDVMIFMKDFKVMQITEVSGFNHETKELIYNKVFEYQIKEEEGNYIGDFVRLNKSCEKINRKKVYNRFKEANG